MASMFAGANVFNGNIVNWDVSEVTTMLGMFVEARLFNQNIGGWNVAQVTTMDLMFAGAAVFNQNIGGWNVGNVTSMESMFQRAESFNQDIGAWNVSSVTTMEQMFGKGYFANRGALAFNQDLSLWDVSSVTNMDSMFSDAVSFNQNISTWDVSSVTDMSDMFNNALTFNQDIGSWNVGMVNNMDEMFMLATSFDQNLENWNVENVTNAADMFGGVTLSTANYDALLIGWNAQNLQPNVPFSGGNSNYCAGEIPRNNMISTDNWTIIDGGLVCPSQGFITTWKTDNPGTSAINQITIPTAGGDNYTVDWGDGTTTVGETGPATHTYATPGTYTVSITGNFPRIAFNNGGDKDKILTIEQWGDNPWTTMEVAFYGCTNLTGNFTDAPDLSNVTSMRFMFGDAEMFNSSIGNWDVSNVITDMTGLFTQADIFNQDIGAWDVSNVTDMSVMFGTATLFNQDIGTWNVGNVEDMTQMFVQATSFNQDIGNWNVQNVTNMIAMFDTATSFNQNIGSWTVDNVTDMGFMFSSATAFNQDISGWTVDNVTNMQAMFQNASSFNQNISSWDVTNNMNMNRMFSGAIVFNQDIGTWNTENVTDMTRMFHNAVNFDQNLGNWNVQNLTNAEDMFQNVTLSTANYDALLIGWNAQNLQPNVPFSGGNSQFCAGEAARQNMIDTDGWTIIDGGLAGPTVDDLTDQNASNSYTLPTIIGSNLTGAEAYYTGTDGTGIQYNAMDVILFDPAETYPITLYIYDGAGTCASEESFLLTITDSCTPPTADSPEDIEACGSYTLPALNTGNDYYSDTNAQGVQLNEGDSIDTSQTIYVFAGSPGCFDENSFVVTIDTPVTVDQLTDVTECESYTLPVLANGNYFTEAGGSGNELFIGDTLSTSQTVFIYFESVICSDEHSFEVTIDPSICEEPIEEEPNTEEESCEIEFPNFFTPNGDGRNEFFELMNNPCGHQGELRIYDRYGKLVFQTNDLNRGWDGTIGGTQGPSTDYWYQFIDSETGQMITSHFALKR